jgi:hypothetical protein
MQTQPLAGNKAVAAIESIRSAHEADGIGQSRLHMAAKDESGLQEVATLLEIDRDGAKEKIKTDAFHHTWQQSTIPMSRSSPSFSSFSLKMPRRRTKKDACHRYWRHDTTLTSRSLQRFWRLSLKLAVLRGKNLGFLIFWSECVLSLKLMHPVLQFLDPETP